MKRPVSGKYADYRHVKDIGSERKHAAVLKDKCLNGDDHGHHQNRRSRTKRNGQQRAAHQVSTGADAHGEVDHLGGEHKCSHHAQQGNARIFQFAARLPYHQSEGRHGDGVHRRPYWWR